MLAVVDSDCRSHSQQMIAYSLALLAASVFAFHVGLAGKVSLTTAIVLGVAFLVPIVAAAVSRGERAMRLSFLTSIVYLPLLLGLMVLDRIPA